MLAELRAEREQVEGAILALERMARGHGQRRGLATDVNDRDETPWATDLR